MTPTSTSEQRETRVSKEPIPDLVDEYAHRLELRQRRHARDVVQHPDQVLEQPGAQTSAELASLAARYGNFQAQDMAVNKFDRAALAADVRSMAMALLRLTRE